MKPIIGYKFITSEMESKEDDSLWKVGKWKKYKVRKDTLNSGFVAYKTPRQSLQYIHGDKWFIVEGKGNIKEEKGGRFVCSEMRLKKEIPIRVLKRWALWNAKQCLKNYTEEYSIDKRVSDCIKICDDFLDEKATIEELREAESEAESAVRSAAWSVVLSIRWEAESTAYLAESAACSAVWSARSAARSAVKSVACSAEESAEYFLACSAARLPAGSVEESKAELIAESVADKELLRLVKEYIK